MPFPKIPGFGSRNDTTRVDSGVAYVHERTVEFGETIITVQNIGSMMMFDGRRNHGPAFLGGAIVLLGIAALGAAKVLGLLLLLVGFGLIVWSFVRPVDVFLSIGTGDGRFTNIVSTNRTFLQEIRLFLRTKLDTNNTAIQGVINIGSATIQRLDTRGGSVVQGDGNTIAGAHSSLLVGQTAGAQT
jgi:hypothetical protein